MNQKEIWRVRYKNLNKYFPNRHINSIVFGSGNLRHELSKFMAGWIIFKGGDLRVLFNQIIPHINDFCEKVEFLDDWFFESRCFITEVSDIDNPNKGKYDLVLLDNNERIEFDDTHSSKNKDNVTIFNIDKDRSELNDEKRDSARVNGVSGDLRKKSVNG